MQIDFAKQEIPPELCFDPFFFSLQYPDSYSPITLETIALAQLFIFSFSLCHLSTWLAIRGAVEATIKVLSIGTPIRYIKPRIQQGYLYLWRTSLIHVKIRLNIL